MKKLIFLILAVVFPVDALADSIVPVRTIRAGAIIALDDVTLRNIAHKQAFSHVDDVAGQEARTTLYAGRPILFKDVGPPALVARNQIVTVTYMSSGLTITTEGRSLQRGGIGDRIRIMNLDSRATVFGQVQSDGSVRVFN